MFSTLPLCPVEVVNEAVNVKKLIHITESNKKQNALYSKVLNRHYVCVNIFYLNKCNINLNLARSTAC